MESSTRDDYQPDATVDTGAIYSQYVPDRVEVGVNPPSYFVLDTDFARTELENPPDPTNWTRSQVRFYLMWAIQQFGLLSLDIENVDLDGKEMCNLTAAHFRKMIPEDSIFDFWIHLTLLKHFKQLYVVEIERPPPQAISWTGLMQQPVPQPLGNNDIMSNGLAIEIEQPPPQAISWTGLMQQPVPQPLGNNDIMSNGLAIEIEQPPPQAISWTGLMQQPVPQPLGNNDIMSNGLAIEIEQPPPQAISWTGLMQQPVPQPLGNNNIMSNGLAIEIEQPPPQAISWTGLMQQPVPQPLGNNDIMSNGLAIEIEQPPPQAISWTGLMQQPVPQPLGNNDIMSNGLAIEIEQPPPQAISWTGLMQQPVPQPLGNNDIMSNGLASNQRMTSENRIPQRKTAHEKKHGYAVYKFLLTLLTNEEYKEIISWVGEGEFKLHDPERVAQLWGDYTNNPRMNYDKFSRNLRNLYEPKILEKVRGKNFTYKMCDISQLG